MQADVLVGATATQSKNGHARVKPEKPMPLTDLGLAERLVRDYGHQMRYCHP